MVVQFKKFPIPNRFLEITETFFLSDLLFWRIDLSFFYWKFFFSNLELFLACRRSDMIIIRPEKRSYHFSITVFIAASNELESLKLRALFESRKLMHESSKMCQLPKQFRWAGFKPSDLLL